MAINVPIFRFLNKEQGKKIAKAFKIIKCSKGEVMLTDGEPVPGIFIVIEGAVDVYTGKFEAFLTRLEYGNTIGEMSLIENRTASASVRVAENETVLLLCKSDDFRKVLNDDPELAANFYKGAAGILSNRLRTSNNHIQTELSETKSDLQNILDDEKVIKKIGKERKEIPNVSKTSIAHLETILPMIENMKNNSPEDKEMLTQMSTSINDAIKAEAMNFERINKRVSKMQNYLDGNSKAI